MTQPPTTDQDRMDDLWYPRQTPAGGIDYADYADTPSRGMPIATRPVRRRFRSLFGELLLVTVLSVATAAAMGWRVLGHAKQVIPGSGSDPFTGIWSLAWSGHALNPGSGIPFASMFDANAFYPARYSLAFADPLLGYGPLLWFFHGTTGLVLAYNLLFVFAPALSSLGAYALARQLGAHPVGAAVAGAAFAYAPWHSAEFSELGVLSTGPLVIALAMLARGHGLTLTGLRTPSRPLWVLLGWIVAAWQLTLGLVDGLPFVYLMAGIVVLVALIAPVRLIRARRADRRAEYEPVPGAETRVRAFARPRIGGLLVADLIGGAVFAGAAAMMAYPYFQVRKIDPSAVRAADGLDQVALHSPRPIDLVTPPSLHGTWSFVTSGQTLTGGSNDLRLLPGAILLGFAVLGLLFSTWRWWWRLVLALSAAVIAALALGSRFPGQLFPGRDAPYVLLWRYVPGWVMDGTPGRLIIFATLPLALLAAGAVSRFCGRGVFGYAGRAPRLRTVLYAVVPVLVVLEGWFSIPQAAIPATPRAVTAADGPMVVLPSVAGNDSRVMFWTATRSFPALADGQSTITPTSLLTMRAQMAGFPDARSVSFLRAKGFRSVVVLRGQFGTPPWPTVNQQPDPKLGLTRSDLGDSVLYTVGPVGTATSTAK